MLLQQRASLLHGQVPRRLPWSGTPTETQGPGGQRPMLCKARAPARAEKIFNVKRYVSPCVAHGRAHRYRCRAQIRRLKKEHATVPMAGKMQHGPHARGGRDPEGPANRTSFSCFSHECHRPLAAPEALPQIVQIPRAINLLREYNTIQNILVTQVKPATSC